MFFVRRICRWCQPGSERHRTSEVRSAERLRHGHQERRADDNKHQSPMHHGHEGVRGQVARGAALRRLPGEQEVPAESAERRGHGVRHDGRPLLHWHDRWHDLGRLRLARSRHNHRWPIRLVDSHAEQAAIRIEHAHYDGTLRLAEHAEHGQSVVVLWRFGCSASRSCPALLRIWWLNNC